MGLHTLVCVCVCVYGLVRVWVDGGEKAKSR